MKKYAESIEILYDEYADNSVKSSITAVYVTRPVVGVNNILYNYYPEYEMMQIDDKYHIRLSLPVVYIGESTLPTVNDLAGKIIVRNPLYFTSKNLKEENGKFVIEANVAYDQMLSRNKEIADACVAAVIAATDITIILVIVGMKIRERKKKKAVSLP